MRLIAPERLRVYAVFWRHRELPDEQQYNLSVSATTVERAIAKVKREVLDEYAGTRADILIDSVELRS